MKPNPRPQDHWRDLCAQLDEDDGLTARQQKHGRDRRNENTGKPDRSIQRLCAQARQAIRLALLSDCSDSDLQALDVRWVEPWPDARRLRVHLSPAQGERNSIESLADKVDSVGHLLRHAVTQAVTRKRAPRLCFVIRPFVEDSENSHEA